MVETPPSTRRGRGLPIGLMAVGGAGLVAGGVLAWRVDATAQQVEQSDDLEEVRALNARGGRLATGADVALITGGALLVTGAVLWVRGRSAPDAASSSLRVAPVVGVEQAGAMVTFSF